MAIVGAGDYSQVVTELVWDNGYEIECYLDEFHYSRFIRDVPVRQFMPFLSEYATGHCFALAVGDNAVRSRLARLIREFGGTLPSLIHSTAFVCRTASVGSGSTVSARAAVMSSSTIASNVIVCAGAVVSHHVSIEDNCLIGVGSHLGSRARVHQGALLGVGSVVKPGISIGAESVLGAGSTAYDNLPDQFTRAGDRQWLAS